MPRGLRRIFAYWRAEQRTITQGFVALVIASFGSLVAGITLGAITGTLQALPGLMVMLPAAIGMRGNIFGALGSRLGTSIHSGLYVPSREREGIVYQNVYAATVLTVVISLLLGVLAKILSSALGIESISMIDFVVISVVGGVLSSIVVGAFTLLLSVRAHRQGWDLDSVAAPLVTAAGDAVTIPSLFLATFLVGIPWVTPVIAAVVTAIAAYATVQGLRTDLTLARRILRESILLLTLAGAVDILAGLFVQVRLDRFLAFPALLVLIPPFLEGAGALGGMLASRLASKLHLGVVTPRGLPEPVAALDASIVVLFAIVDFTLIGIAADLAAAVVGLESPGAVTVVWVSLFAGLMATVLAVVVAYYTAVATFRLGLDPDNHGIPMITSTMDLVGVLTIVIALLVFGIA